MYPRSKFRFTFLLLIFLTAHLAAHAEVSKTREYTEDGIKYTEQTIERDFTKNGITYHEEKRIRSDGKILGSFTYATGGQISSSTRPLSKEEIELNNALSECRTFQTSRPHPIMRSFTIKYEVRPDSPSGKCRFTQTMPNNGLQTCLFSVDQRKEMKDRALEKFMSNEEICKITGY